MLIATSPLTLQGEPFRMNPSPASTFKGDEKLSWLERGVNN
jgi:hypothetical protein